MNRQNSPTVHIVVDMLNDFIDGALACNNADNAVRECVKYINSHPEQRVFYICDSHPKDHCSFTENGGTWVTHCVKGSNGQKISSAFFERIDKMASRPCSNNIFEKGRDSNVEQYSGYEAMDRKLRAIHNLINRDREHILISGIATEFCVKETALDFSRNGYRISLLEKALAYVSEENHKKTLILFDLV